MVNFRYWYPNYVCERGWIWNDLNPNRKVCQEIQLIEMKVLHKRKEIFFLLANSFTIWNKQSLTNNSEIVC